MTKKTECPPEDQEFVFEEENEEENPKGSLKKLREKLKICQQERQEYLEASQRLKADYVNLRRTEAQAREEIVKFAKQTLLVEMMELADTFDLAMANREIWESAPENWRQGVEYIYDKLKGIFQHNGLEELNPLGQPFVPEDQEAVATIDTDDLDKDNIVLEVVQRGYRLHGRVVRPASVKVGHFIKS